MTARDEKRGRKKERREGRGLGAEIRISVYQCVATGSKSICGPCVITESKWKQNSECESTSGQLGGAAGFLPKSGCPVFGVARSAFAQLKLVHQLCQILEKTDLVMMTHTIFTSWLDYCILCGVA